MLKTKALNKTYGNQNVLTDFNMSINSGDIVSVVGSSGSGKTTLLRLISGLEKPDSGQIILNNEIVNSENTFIIPEDRDCSLVFQDYALFPNMSMRQNIYFGKNSDNNREKIEQLIQLTKIETIMDKFPHECSGGEQQRVALVRSLAIDPSLILMDEPFSNLDANLKSSLGSIVQKLLKKLKTTAIIVTHDVIDAMVISDRMIVIDEGEIIQEGIPNEIYHNPKSKKIALLFGETNFIPLKFFPGAKNHFFDLKSNESLISIRPNQFRIFDEDTISMEAVFNGKIKSIKKIASEYRLELICDDLTLNISFRNPKKLSVGEKLKVSLL
ncbi:MAG: ABC transporter [Candidatus Marinimicrobia bacterium]|nr:ABC transporter [Candidatus Neomarinimicrobiota bacterium]